jgi:mannitol-1-phosphate/altronate dehydrogenase
MRLTVESVDRASAAVKRPQYARTEVTPGIVHLGIGAFHRAHQAVVIDDVLERESGWGIIGVSFRRPDTKEALEPQDGLYTLLIKDGDTRASRIVGSLPSVLDARTEKEALLSRMDGSQKLPQRLLGTISDRLRAGAPIERLSLTLAAWMIYAQGKDFAASPSWCKTRWRPSLRRSIRSDWSRDICRWSEYSHGS